MFKKRQNSQKVQKFELALEAEEDLRRPEKEDQQLEEEFEVAKVKLPTFKKKAVIDLGQDSESTRHIDYDEEYQSNDKDLKKIKKKKMIANADASFDYSALQSKQNAEIQSAYDINSLREEMGRANTETSAFLKNIFQSAKVENKVEEEDDIQTDQIPNIEQQREEAPTLPLREATEQRIIDEDNFDAGNYQKYQSEYEQEQMIEEMQQEQEYYNNEEEQYSKKFKEEIERLKQQRKSNSSNISKDEYIQLCKNGDQNLSTNMDQKRMAMFGTNKNGYTPDIHIEDVDLSDEEFNEMEDEFVSNALKQTNLVDRDFTSLRSKGSLAQMKSQKAEQLAIANLEKYTIQNTIEMLEEAHLSNLKTKHADAEKVATIEKVLIKSREDIIKWSEEKLAFEQQESKIDECLNFFSEFNEMINEKGKEVKTAISENQKLNKRYFGSNERRLCAYSNSYLQSLGLPLICKYKNNYDAPQLLLQFQERQHQLGEENIDSEEKDKEDEQYQMFNSNIQRLAMEESEKLKRKHKLQSQELEGYSSDEDDVDKEERQTEDNGEFADEKLALAAATQDILDEIDDYYRDVTNFLKFATEYAAVNEEGLTIEDIAFECLKNETTIQMFAFDPLGKYGSQLFKDVNSLPLFKQLQQASEQYPVQVPKTIIMIVSLKVKQRLIEEFVLPKIEEEVKLCYNPYSSKQTTQLASCLFQLIELSFIKSEYKSAKTLPIIQKVLSAIVLKFDEVLRFTIQSPLNLAAPTSQKSYDFLQFCAGRNLRLAENILKTRQFLPSSNIIKIAQESALTAALKQILILPEQYSSKKAHYFAKALLIFPLDFILINDKIKSNLLPIYQSYQSIIQTSADYLSSEEKEQLDKLDQMLSVN